MNVKQQIDVRYFPLIITEVVVRGWAVTFNVWLS